MAGIYIRDRKNHETINSTYFLRTATGSGDVSSWMIGDSISVCFEITKSQAEQIRENLPSDRFYCSDELLSVGCIVVKRRRSIIWKRHGVFEELVDCSVTLEAETGIMEDLLLWICLGKTPVWMESA